mgnify:CR=1 FL=1
MIQGNRDTDDLGSSLKLAYQTQTEIKIRIRNRKRKRNEKRKGKTGFVVNYYAYEEVYLVTALVPSETACLASSPGRRSLTAV